MKKETTSPAFRRTDQAIMQAMIRLLKAKTFQEICIQDILEETPVSRSTFYAHYEDKYQLAKKMLDTLLDLQQEIVMQLKHMKKSDYGTLIQQMLIKNHDLADALLKIHTDQVDLRSALAKQFETAYLAKDSGSNRKEEAAVYAQTMVALQLSYLKQTHTEAIDSEYTDRIIIPVLLHILQLDDDPVTLDFVYNRLREKQEEQFID